MTHFRLNLCNACIYATVALGVAFLPSINYALPKLFNREAVIKKFEFLKTTQWKPVFSGGFGKAATSATGVSRAFPIVNPTTDEFFIYSVNNHSQSADTYNVFFGGQRHLKNAWDVQLGLGYHTLGNFSVRGILTQGADFPSADNYSYRYGIMSRQLLIESKFLYTHREYCHPYVTVGIGESLNTDLSFKTSVPPFLTFTREYKNKTSQRFSYALGFGVDMDLTQSIRFGLGYRFNSLGSSRLGSAVIDTTPVSGTLKSRHLYAQEILTQFTLII